MINIPKDPNAQMAFEALCKHVAAQHGRDWETTSPEDKERISLHVRESRLKGFMEQGEARTLAESGKFVCEANYAFKTIVDQCEHYRIYRCDGGHHYGVVFIEHKESTGSNGNEIKYVIKNGKVVAEMVDPVRNPNVMEID